EYPEYDPSYAVIQGPYTATFNDYVRQELKYESDLPYEILTGKVWPWNYESHQNEFVNVAETLRQAMTVNPHLKVYVANGYYDLATPFLATEYTFNHIGLDSTLLENITMHYYEAGHMMYAHLPSLAQMKVDMDGFLETAVPD
ncbi:Carboxypeptidase-related protein, partial [hydrothermal vent metagenome]